MSQIKITQGMNVLVLGGGGREHAMVWALARDEHVKKIYCAPGNGGTKSLAVNMSLELSNHEAVMNFVRLKDIHLTIVGPEAPLADGIVDAFSEAGLLIFGPTRKAAQLESSKVFARHFMARHGIPQPQYRACNSSHEALEAGEEFGLPAVVKADGLAAGKGVIICHTREEFSHACERMFREQEFGEAGLTVSVEEFLAGEELSVFAVCDGKNFKILNTAQDHKRAFDGDRGPNTGGMGAYSPTPLSTPELLEKVSLQIIRPTLNGMAEEGHPFTGFLYAGIMVVDGEPCVIEFNVRMGDPETQVVLPLLESSFARLILSATLGELDKADIRISSQTAVTVVAAAGGYPGKYEKGMFITGLDKVKGLVFHAGTQQRSDGTIVTSGGRVLNVVGFGPDLRSAIDDAYSMIEKIQFKSMFYRRDIGQRGLNYKSGKTS